MDNLVAPVASWRSERVALISLAIVWLAAVVGGGSARPDVILVLPLRICSVLALGICFWHVLPWRLPPQASLSAAVALAAVVAIQLIPLPPSIWERLPGRGLYATLDGVSGLAGAWRPISLAPDLTWNSLLALLPPIATTTCLSLVGERWRRIALMALLATILLSAMLGLMQVAGGPGSALRFYAVTNDDAATGFFANRNHQAVFLAMGIPLTVWWSRISPTRDQIRLRSIIACVVIVFLYTASLATNSRMSFLVAPIAMLAGAAIYLRSRVRPRIRMPIIYAIGGAAIIAAVLAFQFSDRIWRLSASDDVRFQALPDTIRAAKTYFPFGAGYGSFREVFMRFESDALLSPTYLNHAHTEITNLLVEGGIVAAALMALLVVWFLRAMVRLWAPKRDMNPGITMARVASVTLLLPLVSSIADYPLRAPLMTCAAAICVVLMRSAMGCPDEARRAPRPRLVMDDYRV